MIIAEGPWLTQDESALVNGLPLGPKAVKIFMDSIHQPDTFIWRPTMDTTYLEDCLLAFVSWPIHKVGLENTPSATAHHSPSTDIPSASKSVGTVTKATGSKSAAKGF